MLQMKLNLLMIMMMMLMHVTNNVVVSDTGLPLEHPNELKVAKYLLRFPETLNRVRQDLTPHVLCDYLYGLSSVFTEFYDSCYCVEKDRKSGEFMCERDHVCLWQRWTESIFFIPRPLLLRKSWKYSNPPPPGLRKIANTTCLVDRDICSGSVGDAWMNVVMVSVLANF